jgi:hypothetical protein
MFDWFGGGWWTWFIWIGVLVVIYYALTSRTLIT